MNAICHNCKALLAAGNVYCLNCGTPAAESVEAENEQETVIRPQAAVRSRSSAWQIPMFAAGAVAVVAVLGFFLYSQREQSANINTTTERTAPATTPTYAPANAVARDDPAPVKTPKPRPVKTPTSIDDTQGKIMDDEMRSRNANGNMPVNLPPPVIEEFNRKGEQLRAVCKNGEPSYWQYDKWATCGMNGGVARWNPRHPKN